MVKSGTATRRPSQQNDFVEKVELTSFTTADELARAAASAWLEEIEKDNRAGKLHCVALSGGRIAQKFFAAAAEQAGARKTSFAGVHFFWADERCVPPNDPESNFKAANKLLFAPLKIPEKQIHRIRGEEPLETAVKMANEEIQRIVSNLGERSPEHFRDCGSTRRASNENANDGASLAAREARALPSLDLVFLGMGEDGHVASLFPDAPAEIIRCAAPFLAVENSPKPPPWRISLSYAALAAARQVWVLVSGPGKEKALRDSLGSGGRTPLGRVLQMRQKTLIFRQIEADKKI
jgi:6-phosphogluconolactonase